MSGRTRIIAVTGVAVVVLVVVAGLLWFQRDETPEVDLESAVAQVEAAGATGDSDSGGDTPSAGTSTDESDEVATTSNTAVDSGATATDTGDAGTGTDAVAADSGDSGTETESADQTADGPSGLAGVWTVQTAEGTVDLAREPAVSFAGFRVNEVLGGGVGDFTAVGRTADVAGSIELTDTALVAATVEVTMSTLRTDNGSRDGQVRRALDTNEFPLATFVLVGPVELPAGMVDGQAFSGSAEGDLTIKDVTNRVVFSLEAQVVGDTVVVVGSSDVVFSDYGVTAPSAPIVVSVEDHGIMEFQLLFAR